MTTRITDPDEIEAVAQKLLAVLGCGVVGLSRAGLSGACGSPTAVPEVSWQ